MVQSGMADRPKISIKPEAPARDPRRRPVRANTAPRPPVQRAPAPGSDTPERPPAADQPRYSPPRAAPPRYAKHAPALRPATPGRPSEHHPATPGRPPESRPAAPGRPSEHRPAAPQRTPEARPASAFPAQPAPEGVRISKLITERGLASRREADEWIEAGWVKVDGRAAVLGQRVAADAPLDIHPLAHTSQARRVTVLINKPVGLVSGQAEDGYQPAVALFTPANRWQGDNSGIEYHPGQQRGLAPAGRLDIDSTGLLVLTQDGRVAKQLVGDETRTEKEYLVRVAAAVGVNLADVDLRRLQHGLELDGQLLRPARVSWANEDQLRFVLREGRKRQIRRMCEQVGLQVVGLKRVRIGSVVLGPLPVGQWRYLGENERF